MSPFHIFQIKAVKMLLNVGADVYMLNHKEQKPSELAMNEDIKKLLLDVEAKKPNPNLKKQNMEEEEEPDYGMQRINSKTL